MLSIFNPENWPYWFGLWTGVMWWLVCATIFTKEKRGRWWFILILSYVAGFAATYGLGLSATTAMTASTSNLLIMGLQLLGLGLFSCGIAGVVPLATIFGTWVIHKVPKGGVIRR